jgi:hypothetical protein
MFPRNFLKRKFLDHNFKISNQLFRYIILYTSHVQPKSIRGPIFDELRGLSGPKFRHFLLEIWLIFLQNLGSFLESPNKELQGPPVAMPPLNNSSYYNFKKVRLEF